MSTMELSNTTALRKMISRRAKTGFLIIVAGICFFIAGAPHADSATLKHPDTAISASITIHSAVTVTGSRIYLNDVIESDTHLPTNTRDMVLMNAPAPGKDRFLPGKWVASVIRTKGRFSDSVEITAPEQVHIRRAYQTLTPERLENFFYSYVEGRIEDPEFKITRIKVRGTDKFPVGAITLDFLEPEPQEISGRVNLRVRVKVDGEKFGWLTLSGWVDCYETVVCTSRYLSRGTVLKPADLEYERMNTSRMPAAVIRDLNDAVGKRLKRNIKAGNYLRRNMLSVPPVIHKGDKVKLVAKSGNIKIVTFGIAKSAGGTGDQIRIENMTSKKTIVGRVKDASTVEVIF